MINKAKGFVNGLICRNAGKNNSFEDRVSSHFLFNSLNSVISLCRKDPEAAAALVGEISTYLQRSLADRAFLLSLDEELEHVLAYINIQKVRFSDRLRIVLDIGDNIQCSIPALTLQPIVDNAINHGVLKRKTGGTVSVSIRKLPYSVQITVSDDGVGMTGEQVGLLFKRSNKEHSLYKINHVLQTAGIKGLQIKSVLNEGTTVMIEIPS